MDTDKFFRLLPELYQSFTESSNNSKKSDFLKLKKKFNSQLSTNTMQILNAAVSCLENREVYCQISSHPDASIMSALLDNEQAMEKLLIEVGFHRVQVMRDNFNVIGYGYK